MTTDQMLGRGWRVVAGELLYSAAWLSDPVPAEPTTPGRIPKAGGGLPEGLDEALSHYGEMLHHIPRTGADTAPV